MKISYKILRIYMPDIKQVSYSLWLLLHFYPSAHNEKSINTEGNDDTTDFATLRRKASFLGYPRTMISNFNLTFYS
jgi:hypothetical protein